MKTLGTALLILMLGTLAACTEPCIPKGRSAVVMQKGDTLDNRCGRGMSCTTIAVSTVKARDEGNRNTYICQTSGTEFRLLEEGDVLVGPWGW